MHSRIRATAVVGLLLALAIPGQAFAVTSDSAVAESINVLPTLVVTGFPATLAYPDSLPGDAASAPTIGFTVVTTNPTGWSLSVAAQDLKSGSLSIPSTAHSWHAVITSQAFGSCGSATTRDVTYAGPAGTFQSIGASNIGAYDGSCGVNTLDSKLTIPAGQTPGAYSGTVTFRVATR